MTKISCPKQVKNLIMLFACTYMVSYITRINYGAVITEIESATGFSKSMLSMATTGSFITYGIGQLFSGFLGDRISPKKMITFGLIVTVLMNLLLSVCRTPYEMTSVCCVNGFAQSFMWPPLVRLMTALLNDDDYKRASTKVSWGSALGTVAVYLVSPALISLIGWRSVFIFSAVCGTLMIFIWNKYSYDIEADGTAEAEKEKSTGSRWFHPVLICVMAAIVLQGMLRDGVTTWTPSYIAETYNFGSAVSILTGVTLPVFSILCYQASSVLYVKKISNPLLCSGVFFAAGTVFAALLYLLGGRAAVFSVLSLALLTGCMHGVNLMLIYMLPPYFQKYGNVSAISGALNFCTYVGSAISTYGTAVISENYGWSATAAVWTVVALAGTVLSLVSVRPWKKKFSGM